MKLVTNTHLKTHGMTCSEYKEEFPGVSLGQTDWFSAWRNSDKNAKHMNAQSELIKNDEELQLRRKTNVTLAWESEELRQRHSVIMKEVAKTNENFIKSQQNKVVTPTMKLSNFDRWVRKYGYDEAVKRQMEWQVKNVLPSTSRNTKPERQLVELLINLNAKFNQQYHVLHYYCDFYLPTSNLVIEVFGNYYHADPLTHKSDDLIGRKGSLAQDIWDYDAKKIATLRSYGLNVLVIWERDIKCMTTEQLRQKIMEATC